MVRTAITLTLTLSWLKRAFASVFRVVFSTAIKGSVHEIHCMIEAKKKDAALFQLVEDLKGEKNITWLDQSSFEIQ